MLMCEVPYMYYFFSYQTHNALHIAHESPKCDGHVEEGRWERRRPPLPPPKKIIKEAMTLFYFNYRVHV